MIAAVETIGRGDLTAAAFFNLILLGYGLPAALAIGVALLPARRVQCSIVLARQSPSCC